MARPANHPAALNGRIGVLLVNLGSPEAPTRAAVRSYLKEFLSDRRVVEIPPLLWQPILRGFVLTTRPSRSAHAYAQIWTEEGSPLVAITRRQAEKVQTALGSDVIVDWALWPAFDQRPACRTSGRWMRPHPPRAALPAIFKRNDRNCIRRSCCGPCRDALAAQPPRPAAIL